MLDKIKRALISCWYFCTSLLFFEMCKISFSFVVKAVGFMALGHAVMCLILFGASIGAFLKIEKVWSSV